jgi:hypothetical protein
VTGKPGTVSVDPFRLMIDRMRDDNMLRGLEPARAGQQRTTH